MEYKTVGQLKVPQNLDPEKQKLVNEIASNYLNELSDINLENTKKRSKLAAGAGLEIGSAFIPAGLGVRLSGTAIKALAPYVGRKIAKEIGTGIVSGGLSGAGFGTGRGIIENKNPINTAAYDALIGASIGGAGGAAIGKVGKEIAKKNLKNFKDSNNYYKNYEQGQKINNDDIGNIILTSQGFKETNIQNPKFFDKVIDLSKNLRGAKLLGKELPTNEHKYNIDYFNRLGGNDVDYLVAHNADSGKNFFHKVTDKELTGPKPEAQSPSNNIIANKEQNLNPFNQYFDDYIADLKNKTNAMQEYRALKEGINNGGENILYDTIDSMKKELPKYIEKEVTIPATNRHYEGGYTSPKVNKLLDDFTSGKSLDEVINTSSSEQFPTERIKQLYDDFSNGVYKRIEGQPARTEIRQVYNPEYRPLYKQSSNEDIIEYYNSNSATDKIGHGYNNYSMSNNAVQAYKNGNMPLSKWNKGNIIGRIKEISNEFDIPFNEDVLTKMSVKELKGYLKKNGYHHTSKFYNTTDFYNIDIEKLLEQADKI